MFEMKKILKKSIQAMDQVTNFIILLLILAAMGLSGYMLWDSDQVYQEADAKKYEIYMPTMKHMKSFKELQKINPDVFGWIRVNDTQINYPLLQAKDDEKYMNTDVEGKYSLSGSIFLHCANKSEFSDFNNIIYGHHMEKHKMFGDIGEFTNKRYFEEHPYGNLFYSGKDHGIEFFALLQVDAYNDTIFNVCQADEHSKEQYLKEVMDHALYKRAMDITTKDHLVLLTTCTSDMTNGRNILVGRISDHIYPEAKKAINKGTGIDHLKNLLPVIAWILVIVMIVLWIIGKKRRKNDRKI